MNEEVKQEMQAAKIKADADLRDTIQRRKLAAFDYAKHLSRCSIEELRRAGQRGTAIEAAGQAIIKEAAEIEKLIQTHERIWP